MQNPVPTAVCPHDPLNYEAYHLHQFKFNFSNFKIFRFVGLLVTVVENEGGLLT
jgi:hypothetical protein